MLLYRYTRKWGSLRGSSRIIMMQRPNNQNYIYKRPQLSVFSWHTRRVTTIQDSNTTTYSSLIQNLQVHGVDWRFGTQLHWHHGNLMVVFFGLNHRLSFALISESQKKFWTFFWGGGIAFMTHFFAPLDNFGATLHPCFRYRTPTSRLGLKAGGAY